VDSRGHFSSPLMRSPMPVAMTQASPDPSAQAPAGSVPVRDLLAGFSIEATPKQVERTDSLAALLPEGTGVYVPFLPGADMRDCIAACSKLKRLAFRPVPHVAARALGSREKLAAHLGRLEDEGVTSLLLIAGDCARPAGPFTSTLDVFDSGLLQRYGFRNIGVAGHPEGHPVAGRDVLTDALRRKARYALETESTMWIVTQFAFAVEPVIRWLDALRDDDIRLPVRVGLPGPARVQTLLRYAAQCGIGASSRMLVRRPGSVIRLLGRWTPDELLLELAQHARAQPGAVAGIHVFPFGGLAQFKEHFYG
jgi:methylenetetrahydrofolate reductase (NADPH)